MTSETFQKAVLNFNLINLFFIENLYVFHVSSVSFGEALCFASSRISRYVHPFVECDNLVLLLLIYARVN